MSSKLVRSAGGRLDGDLCCQPFFVAPGGCRPLRPCRLTSARQNTLSTERVSRPEAQPGRYLRKGPTILGGMVADLSYASAVESSALEDGLESLVYEPAPDQEGRLGIGVRANQHAIVGVGAGHEDEGGEIFGSQDFDQCHRLTLSCHGSHLEHNRARRNERRFNRRLCRRGSRESLRGRTRSFRRVERVYVHRGEGTGL